MMQTLLNAHEDYASLTQLIRAAHGSGFDPEQRQRALRSAPGGGLRRAGSGDRRGALRAPCAQVSPRPLFERHIGPIRTE
jgi:hypothetical protein